MALSVVRNESKIKFGSSIRQPRARTASVLRLTFSLDQSGDGCHQVFIPLVEIVVGRERESIYTSSTMDYDEYGFFDYNPFRYMAPASRRALEREQTAKSLFHDAKVQFEQQHPLDELAAAGKQNHILDDIVPPKYHLTSHTWGTFRRWVENNHPGWKTKRRVATEDEIQDYLEESDSNECPSKGKNYFISFVYQHPAASTEQAANGKREAGEDEGKPPAKKLKKSSLPAPERRTNKSSISLEDLPEPMLTHILSYCDAPTLGKMVPMSQTLCRLAKQDTVWEANLKILLHELFDGSFRLTKCSWGGGQFVADPTTPLSQRDDWRESKALLRWWGDPSRPQGFKRIQKKSVEKLDGIVHRLKVNTSAALAPPKRRSQRAAVASQTSELDNQDGLVKRLYGFLETNVPLRDYYHRSGHLAYRSNLPPGNVFSDTEAIFCSECFASCWTKPAEFRNLPNLFWFL